MNSDFEIQDTTLMDAKIIIPFCREDERGSFIKDFLFEFYNKNNLDSNLDEIFYAKNNAPNILRGMHFAIKFPQAKIVRCISGSIYDVIVDLRPNSPTYLKREGFYLTEENNKVLYVPKGFAHGYLTLSPCIVSYKCSGKFVKEYDTGVIYNDKDFSITWPFTGSEIVISEKDKNLKTYAEMKDKIEY